MQWVQKLCKNLQLQIEGTPMTSRVLLIGKAGRYSMPPTSEGYRYRGERSMERYLLLRDVRTLGMATGSQSLTSGD